MTWGAGVVVEGVDFVEQTYLVLESELASA